MKKILLIVIFSFLMISFSNKAEAIPIFYSFGGEKINTVVDLPNDTTTISDNGHYINIGCIYKQFSVFWIPIWNWDESYCLTYEGLDDTYTAIDEEQAEEIAVKFDAKLGGASPSFWNKIGGKLIILVVLGLIIWSYVGKKDDEAAPTDNDDNA